MTEIRPLKSEKIPLLEEFLYQAIFILPGLEPLPRTILKEPDLEMYIKDFGQQPDDWALAAEVDGLLVGAVWVRIMKDYGYYDDRTPSLSISFLPDFRGQGLGQQLMTACWTCSRPKATQVSPFPFPKTIPPFAFIKDWALLRLKRGKMTI